MLFASLIQQILFRLFFFYLMKNDIQCIDIIQNVICQNRDFCFCVKE